MEITIYGKDGTARATVSPADSSTQQKEIQGDNVLALSFTHWAHIAFDVNDYADYEGERYWLMEQYQPTQKSESEWDYDLKLYGAESLIKRFLVIETTDGNAEPVFTLTAPPREHVAMIVKCINDGLGHTTDWKVGEVTGTDNIVIDYEGKYCDEALKEIAEAVGGQSEWWIDGTTVNVCRCEHGERLTIGYGNGLLGLERDTSNTNKFYTRLFPIGSARNIDAEKYGHARLMLPDGAQYVEVHADEYGIFDHYEGDAFGDIYPRRVGTVTSVRSKEAKDDDGNAYTIYYFGDSGLDFDPNDYEIAGLVKHVSFQEGSELAGLGADDDHYFEVNYDSKTKEFEIITIWPYDDETQLPGGALVPKVGDKYILWNVRMPDEYYTNAEKELAAAVDEYNAEHWQDISVYRGTTDHVWVERNAAELFVGRRVRLESAHYFPADGYRESRITKLTRKVTLPGQVELEMSDALQTGALQKVTDSVSELRSYTKERTGSLPDIIRTGDDTEATDTNLYSARRSRKEFLSKTGSDRAKGLITIEGGLSVGTEGNAAIDAKGNAEALSLIVRQMLGSAVFVNGMTGEGWRLWLDGAGLSRLEIDALTVRQRMDVYELLIDKVRSVGGQMIVSAANGKVETVAESADGYVLTLGAGNPFQPGDMVRCQTFTGGNLKYYWAEVSAADGSTITIAKNELGGYEPEAGDEIVLMGSTTDTGRQSLISISATNDGQPRIDVLNGVSGKSLEDSLRARLGNLDGITDSWFPADNQPHGDGLYADNAYLKGTFLLTTGEDVKTKFEITAGSIKSSIEALRKDVADNTGSYLSNPCFLDGMAKWRTESDGALITAGGNGILLNGALYATGGTYGAVLAEVDGHRTAYINNGYIGQLNADMAGRPTFATNGDGEYEAAPVYFSFLYKCTEAGTLNVGFVNTDKTGFANFDPLEVSEEMETTDGFVQYTCSGLWNGTGNFRLEFTGKIYVYMLVLTTDETEALAYRYRTLFEQTERLVKISAAVFDKDENALKETGLFVKPEGAGLYAQDAEGNVALIGVSVDETGADGKKKSVVKLTADNIQLEGLVTANNNFKILADGSIEAANGIFSGEIHATSGTFEGTVTADSGKIGGFTIDNGRLNWKGYDYFGNDSRSLKLGASNVDTEGMVDVSLNSATTGRFGVKSVGRAAGGACIYASNSSTTPSYPSVSSTYAGYFDGEVYAKTMFLNAVGTYYSGGSKYYTGLTGEVRIDDSDTWLQFVNGVFVGYLKGRDWHTYIS